MKNYVIVFGLLLHFIATDEGINGECLDLNGRSIAEDMHFVPGPDACTLCVCDGGLPKRCKSVLCAPPQDCQSFTRVGQQCCRFVCLDDQHDLGHDSGLRLIVGSAAVLSLCFLLLLLLLRIRQKKSSGPRNRLGSSHQSLRYLTAGGLSYLPQQYFTGPPSMDRHIEFHYQEPPSNLALWKPGSEYFPAGEAPPPYDEAVARETTFSTSILPNAHRTIPLTLAGGTIRVVHSGESPEVTALKALRARAYQNSETLPLQYHISISGFCSGKVRLPQREAQVQVSEETSNNELSPEIISPVAACRGTEERSEGTDTTSDNDDFRSECENCKSSPSTEYLVRNKEAEAPETMTLQRLPKEQDDEFNPRTSLTLPINTKKPRSVLSDLRETWFNAMPESSSEEEED